MRQPSANNPFLRRPRQWARRRELQRLIQALWDGQPSYVVVGDERSGKSVLLESLAQEIPTLDPPAGRRIVVSPLDALSWTAETAEAELGTQAFWRLVLDPLTHETHPELRALLARAMDRGTSMVLEPLSRWLYAHKITLLVLIDHFDALLLSPFRDLRALLSTMRKLGGMAGQGISLVMAAHRRIDELNRETDPWCAGSPFFNVFAQIEVGPLPEEGVRWVLELDGGRFLAEDRAYIQCAAGGHPELLWRAAAGMWEVHERGLDPAIRPLVAGNKLLFAINALLRTTWSRWGIGAQHVVVRALLHELREPVGTSGEPHPESGAAQGTREGGELELWLRDALCAAVGDQHELLRMLDPIDSSLRADLPAPTVPLRQLASEAVALLRRRRLIQRAVRIWRLDPRWAAGLIPPSRAPLPTAMEHLRRTGWIWVDAGEPELRVGALGWWLLDSLGAVARGEVSLVQWLYGLHLEHAQPELVQALEARVAAHRSRLVQGASAWITREWPGEGAP